MGPHTKALSKSCFYHIRSFRQIRSSLDDATAASVASALVSSRLDQMNSVSYGTALKHTKSIKELGRVGWWIARGWGKLTGKMSLKMA